MDFRVVNWAKGSAKTLPEYAVRTVVMREMKWDYWMYRAQPQFVIDQVLMFLGSEAEGQRLASTAPAATNGVRNDYSRR